MSSGTVPCKNCPDATLSSPVCCCLDQAFEYYSSSPTPLELFRSFGIAPLRVLEKSERSLSRDSNPISDGIGPLRWLEERMRLSTRGSNPISDGIGPLSWLVEMSRRSK
eukprot:1741034-Ditylum_brightwellii.AAC.1